MPTKRRRLSIEGPTVIKGHMHKSGIVPLEAHDAEDFALSVRLPGKILVCALVGVLPATAEAKQPDDIFFRDARPPEDGILKHGFFLDLRTGKLVGQDGTNQEPSGVLHCGLIVGQRLRLRFSGGEEPALQASVDDGELAALRFRTPIPRGDYRPCVLLDGRSAVEVEMARSTVGRPSIGVQASQKAPSADLAKMWTERVFTDAVVVCEDGASFTVHRAVLCSASPVFAASFGGHMKEASSARLDIVDAPSEAVEALLRFIYTGLGEPRLAATVLPLAHRYQLDALVARCGEELVEELCPGTAAETVRALRPLREESSLALLWDQVLVKLQADKQMLCAALGCT